MSTTTQTPREHARRDVEPTRTERPTTPTAAVRPPHTLSRTATGSGEANADGAAVAVAHGRDDAASGLNRVGGAVGRLYESDTCTEVRFAANERESLFKQIRTFLKKHDPGHVKPLSPERRKAANEAASIVSVVVGLRRHYARWAEKLGIDKKNAAAFGEEDGVRVTLGDLLMLPKEDREALWAALMVREFALPEEHASDIVRKLVDTITEANKESAEAAQAAFAAVAGNEEPPLEKAKAIVKESIEAGVAHFKLAARARRYIEQQKEAA